MKTNHAAGSAADPTGRERTDALLSFRAELLERGLLAARQSPAGIRDVVQRSWRRTVSAGIRPESVPDAYDDSFDAESPLALSAGGVLDQLTKLLADAPAALILCDERGRIIARRGTDGWVRARLDSMNAGEGFVYSEDTLGTNGLGTSIEERRPVVISGTEHFLDGLHTLTCAAVPVISPVHNRTLGSLSLVLPSGHAHDLSLPLLKQATTEIENRIRRLVVNMDDPAQSIFNQEIKHEIVPGMVTDDHTTLLNNAATFLLTPQDLFRLRELRTTLNRDPFVGRMTLSSGEFDVHADVVETPVSITGPSREGTRILLCRLIPVDTRESGAHDHAPTAGGVDLRQPEGPHTPPSTPEAEAHDADFDRFLSTAPFSLIRSDIQRAARADRVVVWGEPNTGRRRIAQALREHAHRLGKPAPEVAISETASDVTGAVQVVTVSLDRLRELLPHLLTEALSAQVGKPVVLSPAAVHLVRHIRWADNFRTFATVVDAVTAHLRVAEGDASDGLRITSEMLPDFLTDPVHASSLTHLEALERQSIVDALHNFGGNKCRAADYLGISRSTLYRKMKRYKVLG
ncbi:hypothetical protein GCM10022261_01440 [Brevibacterium daeguense]|uniref:Transcriptional regulator of acetoin/glycerol metabolism n=1 Tax=Brevibacterium daeguense TaxID=909936 RepID=A0ABP8EF58_9MICO|nr:helix-turn-helix domain-containing protein [Brevibacterium daeguense]